MLKDMKIVSSSEVSTIPGGMPLVIFDPSDSNHPNKENMTKVEVPPFIASQLRPHQVQGVKFVLECLMGLRDEGQYTGAILADGMG